MGYFYAFMVVLLYIFVNDNNKNNNVQITNYHVRTEITQQIWFLFQLLGTHVKQRSLGQSQAWAV